MKGRRRVDIVVVGAGPAGLAAATAAAATGRRVLVIDQAVRAGGQIWRHRSEAALPKQASELLARARGAGVTFAFGARVVDANSPQEIIVDFRGRIAPVGTEAIVLATGAKERFLPFPGWTLPGVTGVGALQALLKSGLRLPGRRVVLAGTGPLLLPVAATLATDGADVLLVAEQADDSKLIRFAASMLSSPGKLIDALRYRAAFLATPYRPATWVTRADGDGQLRSVTLSERGKTRTIDCDWLGAAMGLVPNVELAQLFGCDVRQDGIVIDASQQTTVAGVWAAGECTGVKGEEAGLVEGFIAGAAAAGDPHDTGRSALRARDAGRRLQERLARAFALRPEVTALADEATIICRCEDVTRGQLDPAWSQRQAKLWTRIGMGACQGAVCGPACAALFGWEANAPRPPIQAPAIGGWSEALTHEGIQEPPRNS
ncbi:MAG: FAD/NAD(P)-binding oxidoreductase [Gemmatimonadota bacterium]